MIIPTVMARNSEFQAAPHRPPPRTQPNPQRRSSKNLETKIDAEYPPSSVMKAAISILAIGKNTKADDNDDTPPMAPTTKTSPLIAPRAAMPWVKMKQEGRCQKQRPVAHAELPVSEFAEKRCQPVEVKAPDADAKPLRISQAKTHGAGKDQQNENRPGRSCAVSDAKSGDKRQDQRCQPEFLALRRSERPRARNPHRTDSRPAATRSEKNRPQPRTRADKKTDPPGSDPEDKDRMGRFFRCGLAHVLLRQSRHLFVPLLQKALAFVDEPYFAKS